MRKQYLEAGKIVATQGLKGEVRVQSYCDSAEFLLDFEYMYFIDKADNVTNLEVEYSRVQKNVVILKIADINTVEQAQKLRDKIIYINRDDIELDDTTFFIQDLFGLKVVNHLDNSICYGEIVDVTETGANDVYHVKAESGEIFLVPAIKKIINTTDIDAGVMTITPMRGLFDGDND